MRISIEEVLKHPSVSMDNIKASFLAKLFSSQKWLNSAFWVVLYPIYYIECPAHRLFLIRDASTQTATVKLTKRGALFPFYFNNLVSEQKQWNQALKDLLALTRFRFLLPDERGVQTCVQPDQTTRGKKRLSSFEQ